MQQAIVPGLSEATIRRQSTAESFRRGYDYYRQGAVLSLFWQDKVLIADVRGSQYEPYRVRITLGGGNLIEATCSCPYDWGGWCKHIVAALLKYLERPEGVEQRPALRDLLAGLDREQLQSLLLGLVAARPELVRAIERQTTVFSGTAAASGDAPPPAVIPRSIATDLGSVRSQVSSALHSLDYMRRSDAYRQVGNVVGQVRRLLDQARSLAADGESEGALLYLEAITDEYVDGWENLDDSDGEASGFFTELARAWAQVALGAALSPEERREWADRLTRWQAKLLGYGVDDALDMAQEALLFGWDHPPLQRILRGEGPGEEAEEDEDLIPIRLQVLDQQERHEEYLHLARAEGRWMEYVLMLARLGRVKEAIKEASQRLEVPDQFLVLATSLQEQGNRKAAVYVAKSGLAREGPKGSLGSWLCDLAEDIGDHELALGAAVVAQRSEPSLRLYLRVQSLAGELWPKLKDELLTELRQAEDADPEDQVDILLHEGLLDDAIQVAEREDDPYLILSVVDPVIGYRPDWVIEKASQQAEEIIRASRSDEYDDAVEWLARVRAAYRAAGQEAEWKVYLDRIRSLYGRKYKLMSMLKRFTP